MDGFTDELSLRAKGELWRKVREALSFGNMPPNSETQPPPAERQRLIGRISVSSYLLFRDFFRGGIPVNPATGRLDRVTPGFEIQQLDAQATALTSREPPINNQAVGA